MRAAALVGLVLIAAVSCGKKGPPLAPLIIVPVSVSDVSVNRFGDRVTIRFTPPTKNTDNSAPADVVRVDVFALSAASATDAPEAGVVAQEGSRLEAIPIASRPASGTGQEPQPEPNSPRTFVETLTPQSLQLWSPKRPPPPAAPAPATAPAGEAAKAGETPEATTTGQVKPPVPVRLYALVPVSSKGRRGTPSLATVPIVPPPPPVARPFITYTDQAIRVTWVVGEANAAYNVYEVDASRPTSPPGSPVNGSPVKEAAFEDKRVEFAKQRCYGVTTVESVAQQRIESVLSEPACVTPEDTFPPPAPTGLAAVAAPDAMSLIWDAVTVPDLAGYLVLRGVAPGDTLQPLTPGPIKETTFRDATVTPGTRYVYVVLAVDKSGNRSLEARVEEAAR